MRTAGVVLAGGRSTRMGAPKAALEWHGSTLLRRVVGIVARATSGPVVVVRAPQQQLPDLPADVVVVTDPVEGLGPLQGLAVGLTALADRAEAAFVCSTDLPFLHTAYVGRVLRGFDGTHPDIVMPQVHGYRQPLAAGYRTALGTAAARLVTQERRKPAFLLDDHRVAWLDEAALRADPLLAAVDPDLASVANINTGEEYTAARARPAPEITVQRFGVLASGPGGVHGPRTVLASWLGQAAEAAGLALDRHVVAALNGDAITRDPQTPLVTGDTVAFLSADAGG